MMTGVEVPKPYDERHSRLTAAGSSGSLTHHHHVVVMPRAMVGGFGANTHISPRTV